jgi:hypothetical protein
MNTRAMAYGLLVASLARAAQETPSIEQLAQDLRNVQAELLDVRIELQSSRVGRLENDYAAAMKIRERLVARERSAADEVVSIERQLSSSGASQERHELELERKHAFDRIARATQQRVDAERQEFQIAEELRSARLQLTGLLGRSKQQRQ